MKAFSVFSLNSQLVEFLDRFGSPFTQTWFLEIAKGGGTLMVVYVDCGGKIVASWPIVLSRKYRIFTRGDTPSWTHTNGPVFHPCLSDEERAKAVSILLKQFRWWISCRFVCDPDDSEPALIEAWRAAGFKCRKQETFIRMPWHPDALDQLAKKHRNNIKRSARTFLITEDTSAKEFMDTYLANLKQADLNCYADPKLAQKIIEAGQTSTFQVSEGTEAKRVMVLSAKSKNGETVAAIACLLNQHRMYYWLTTRKRFLPGDDPITGSEDAIKLLITCASRKAQELNLIFDADGISNSSVSALYQRFFPCRAERVIFMRRAPHDPWFVKESVKKYFMLWTKKSIKHFMNFSYRIKKYPLIYVLFDEEQVDAILSIVCITS
jgi:hypothetical protein